MEQFQRVMCSKIPFHWNILYWNILCLYLTFISDEYNFHCRMNISVSIELQDSSFIVLHWSSVQNKTDKEDCEESRHWRPEA